MKCDWFHGVYHTLNKKKKTSIGINIVFMWTIPLSNMTEHKAYYSNHVAIFNCDDCGQSFRIQKELSQNWIKWCASDHPKASPKTIFFWKYQFALNNHTLFMKQIRSMVKLLNHSWQICGVELLYFFYFYLFLVQKPGY